MSPPVVEHPPSPNVEHPPLETEIRDFMLDRQARNLSPRTLQWHGDALGRWAAYCAANGVTTSHDVTPRLLRQWLVTLAGDHNPGGVSNLFRSVRAFLRWYEVEYEPPGWVNPLRRVEAPRVPEERLEPVSLPDVRALLAQCTPRTYTGDRDRAILLTLLDTGLRRAELLALCVGDVNLETGAVAVQSGKGRKPRTVFVGARARRALLAYYRQRGPVAPDARLWLTDEGTPLTAAGLRQMLARRAAAAGIRTPGVHAFRRAFAVNSLRNGMDVITLQRLLGHSTLSIINRYLALTTADLQSAHEQFGVADNL